MLASFLGVLPILTPPLCALAFIMCSKSSGFIFEYCSAGEKVMGVLIHVLNQEYGREIKAGDSG
jgi:hypothetical protein